MTEGYNTFEFLERAYVEVALNDVTQSARRDGALFVVQKMNATKNAEKAFFEMAEALTEALALYAALSSDGLVDVVTGHIQERAKVLKVLVGMSKIVPLDDFLSMLKTTVGKTRP